MKNIFIAIVVASLGVTFAVTDLQGARESNKTKEPAKGEHFDQRDGETAGGRYLHGHRLALLAAPQQRRGRPLRAGVEA
jgi:hypothetical protein